MAVNKDLIDEFNKVFIAMCVKGFLAYDYNFQGRNHTRICKLKT